MEKTMLKDYVDKSTMVAILEELSNLDGWKESITIRERSFGTERRGAYMTEIF
jgi:hypothetical protein